MYRSNITKAQREFLSKVVPLSRLISEWTQSKAEFLGVRSPGIYPSILIADIIVSSGWGEHPISKMDFNKKYSNNLSLVKKDESWKGKFHTFDDIEYKAFRDWEHYAIDISDSMVFDEKYRGALKSWKKEKQILELKKFKDNPGGWHVTIDLYSAAYRLQDFDV